MNQPRIKKLEGLMFKLSSIQNDLCHEPDDKSKDHTQELVDILGELIEGLLRNEI